MNKESTSIKDEISEMSIEHLAAIAFYEVYTEILIRAIDQLQSGLSDTCFLSAIATIKELYKRKALILGSRQLEANYRLGKRVLKDLVEVDKENERKESSELN
jgi:hypothetical protein